MIVLLSLPVSLSVGVPACARVCSCALSGPALLSVSLGAEGI